MQPSCVFSPPPRSSRAIYGNSTGSSEEYPLGKTSTVPAESPRWALAEGTQLISRAFKFLMATCQNTSLTTPMTSSATRPSSELTWFLEGLRPWILICLLALRFVRFLAAWQLAQPDRQD